MSGSMHSHQFNARSQIYQQPQN